MMKNIFLLLLLFPTFASGNEPATADPGELPVDDFPLFDETEIIETYDPLEPFNRAIFAFNDIVYFGLMKPVARGWRHAPEGLRVSVRNFFTNLQAPVRIVNAGLQGKFNGAGVELTRFITNTTLGIGGLYDPAAEHFNQQAVNEDTGQTLGYYGIGSGPYLVLPFLGPSSLRDAIGQIGDTRLDLAYYAWAHNKDSDNYDYLGARSADAINRLSLDKDTYEGIKRDALDPYLFMRDAWTQYRANLVNN